MLMMEEWSGSRADRDSTWWARVVDRFTQTPRSGPAVDPAALGAGLERLLEINRLLKIEYGTPDLGNKSDAVDELVYIILSRRTRESAYQSGFRALKERFADWNDVVSAPAAAVEEVIRPTGLGRKKASTIKQALAMLVERFGACTLEPTRSWPDEEVRALLCSLPEVGPKSAACVMMWSLGRAVFPVDTHVGRVMERVGVWSEAGLSLQGTGHKAKQAILADLIPPSIRLPLHINSLVHGRTVCSPGRPQCETCRIASLCDSAVGGISRWGGPS